MAAVRGILRGSIQALAAGLSLVAEIQEAETTETCSKGQVCPLSPDSKATVCCRCSGSCCHPDNNPDCPFPIWVMYIIIILCSVVLICALVCTCQILTRRSRAHRDGSTTKRLRCIPRTTPFPGRTVPSVFSCKSSSSGSSSDTMVTMSSMTRVPHGIYAIPVKPMGTAPLSGVML